MKLAPRPHLTDRLLRRRALGGALVALGAVALLAPAPARAHFILKAPASWMSQDLAGSPQKLGPCGDEGGGTVTGTITAVHPGETIAITIDEVVFHPGHYRIALATDRAHLPAEPPVTAGSTPCGSVPIDPAPVFPVLADGVFEHTSAFSGPQTTHVTIPANVSCTKCTLQVIEFMSDHPLNNPGGCFYHHCADLAVEPGPAADGGAPASGDASAPSVADASSGNGGNGGAGDVPGASSSSGCAVSTPLGGTPLAFAAAVALALAGLARRRRRAPRA